MGQFPLEFQTVEINNARLAYREQGAGEPVVFVHGSSQDMRTWSHQLAALAREFRPIIYSRRYARPNEDIAPGQDDQMQPHVNDLLSLLSVLKATPAHLVGSSWGGFISLLAAIRAPDSVRSLVLCEPPVLPLFISNNPKPAEIFRLLLTRPVDALRIMRFGLGVVEPTTKAYRVGDIERGGEIFGRAVLGEERLKSMPRERQRMIEENASAEVAQFLGAGFPPLSQTDVKGIQLPVLLVTGKESHPVLRETLTNELARLLPNARHVDVPNASHLMHEEQPDAFNEAVLLFLRGLSPAAAPS